MPRVVLIDGFAFARTGKSIEGSLALADLPRLAEMGGQDARLSFSVGGGKNAKGRASLQVRATGSLDMICQRCLRPVTVPMEIDAELELCGSQVEIATADDEVDRVLASEEMDVVALVEDEVVLSLPMSPRHESCSSGTGDDADAQPLPFARLAALKRGQ